jgi:hypothetical protein
MTTRAIVEVEEDFPVGKQTIIVGAPRPLLAVLAVDHREGPK